MLPAIEVSTGQIAIGDDEIRARIGPLQNAELAVSEILERKIGMKLVREYSLGEKWTAGLRGQAIEQPKDHQRLSAYGVCFASADHCSSCFMARPTASGVHGLGLKTYALRCVGKGAKNSSVDTPTLERQAAAGNPL